ncbi:MAG: sugar ABC transporter ATP-binding protein [Anaerolineae bacterium]|nr:sugar ABC transporter ATP-binding protein [Anaerolineae bacterium]
MNPTSSPNGKPVLSASHINKSFPGVHALKDVSFELHQGEVLGLVGENGAGKSTLMRVLAGVYAPDTGELRMEDDIIHLQSPNDAAKNGIGMVFQEQSLLPNLSVSENIYLGYEDEFMRFGILQWKKLHAAARRQLEKVQLDIDPSARTSSLNFAARQMIELAKTLTLEERTDRHLIILLDEPTSVLEQAEIDILFERVRALKQRASFVFVSHRLDEVLAISDRVLVMKDGKVVANLSNDDGLDVHQLHQLMVGRDLQAEYYRESQQRPYDETVVLEAENISLSGAYHDISFQLHKGEILGIAGVIGSGREELCRTVFGFFTPESGQLHVAGKPVHFKSPTDAVRHGIGYIPRERRTEGLVLYLSVASNITLAGLRKAMHNGLIDYERESGIAREWVEKLSIKTPSIRAMCLNLSGGNQQKTVLAKWLNAESKILILDHPTRGVDVGAKEEVYVLVRELSNAGVSIILTADTLEETIGLSHTILVMRDGVITQRFDASSGHKPQQLQLIEYMV